MSARPPERRGLGRGLSALMAEAGVDLARDPTATPPAPDRRVPVAALRPNPDQPRRIFDAAALDDLARSIREKGVLQPLIVRPLPGEPDRYEIVAGERRWRAAQRAGLHEVPILVREFDDTEVLEIGIVENIQREGLNPIEEAAAYRQLVDRFGRTQDRIAEALGKSRSHVANALRLLSLPPSVQAMVLDGRLSAGHARALVTAADPEGLARRVLARGLNVRQTESLARAAQASAGAPAGPAALETRKDADTRALQESLTAALGLRVTIDHRADGSGAVTIRYRNLDQLDGLCSLLGGNR